MTRTGAWRALIVEDEPAWRELLTEMLTDLGATVEVAGDYDAALATMVEGPFNLALIDLALAGDDHENRDGLRVLSQFRERWPEAQAVLITGYGTVELAVKALTEYGASDFIRKETFDRERFLETVRHVVSPGTIAPATREYTNGAPAKVSDESLPALDASVLIVEDNSSWQSIYAEICEDLSSSIRTAVSYGEARGWLQRETYDLVIVDLNLVSSTSPWENRDGFHLLRLTQEQGVTTIVVSALAAPAEIDRAYEEFDIFAFFDKEGFRRDAFIQLMQEALGEAGHVIPPDSPINDLTDRQMEVLELLVQGKTNKEIASDLFITTNTVKKHVLAIFDKLDVNSRASAAAIAAKHGMRR